MRPKDVAIQHGMNETALRELNKIPARMLIKAGSTLLVPRSGPRSVDVSEHLADHAMMALAPDVPPLRRVAMRAGKRDTMAAIAQALPCEHRSACPVEQRVCSGPPQGGSDHRRLGSPGVYIFDKKRFRSRTRQAGQG